jgi:tellurite resistance-related uncharacterized protein
MAEKVKPEPYRITSVWDENNLPAAIRETHQTKAGVWGILRVLEGSVRLLFEGSSTPVHVSPDCPALIPPEDKHRVELLGPMRMQVEFYSERPEI